MVLDWMPDSVWAALRSPKERQKLLEPSYRQQGDVPVHQVGVPTTAADYAPVPVTQPQYVVHVYGESVQYNDRENVDHPLRHLGYTIKHHPMDLLKYLWDHAQKGFNWVLWNFNDFVAQLDNWDGSWFSLITNMHLWWRGMVLLMIGIGVLEVSQLVNALANWLRLAFDVLKSAFGLVGSAVDELIYLLHKIWDDLAYWFTPLTKYLTN